MRAVGSARSPPDDYIILNQPGGTRYATVGGLWVITYGLDQFLVVDDENPDQGLGDLREHQPRRSGPPTRSDGS